MPEFKANTVAQVKGISALSMSKLNDLYTTARILEIPVDWLATVISFETAGTFSPSVTNRAGSGAFGLIQFMPKTAAYLLGYPDTPEGRAAAVKKGKAMSFSAQLKKMVIPYFKGQKYRSLQDVYLRVFYPAAMNKADNHVIGAAPGAVYEQNRGFDRDGKGYITRKDVTRTIESVWNAAQGYPRITIKTDFWAQIAFGVALSAGTIYAYTHRYKWLG